MTAIPTIAFIRATTLLSDALVLSYMASQQIQISRDFAPIWGLDAKCVFVKGGDQIPVGAWQLWFKDHSPEADALGYHDDDGIPRGYVFVADDLANGNSWTVTASHEALEMLADPTINQTRRAVQRGVTWEFALEVCDACEDDTLSYLVRGHHLSDFVTPAWFDQHAAGPFTFRHKIAAPLELAEGGYIGVREISPRRGDWTQRFAQEVAAGRSVKGPMSRTMRRFEAALNPTSDAPVG